MRDHAQLANPTATPRRIVAKMGQLMAWMDTLETQLAVARATAAKPLSALVVTNSPAVARLAHRRLLG